MARFKLLKKLEKNFAMLITSGTKLVEQEDVVRLSQRDLDRLEAISRKRAARERKLKDIFEVNVVCVRNVIERKRVRSKAHDVRSILSTHSYRHVQRIHSMSRNLSFVLVDDISPMSSSPGVTETSEHSLMK